MEIEEPVIANRGSRFNFLTSIWIVPFIAAIIALWLSYEHFSKLGPEIRIELKNSGGLVAGQSVIKFRDVPVGKVSRIEINSQKDGVVVYARINQDAKEFLNETTKFWVVKPEVDYSGVKGLDTLLSGSYIYMYAKKGKQEKEEFTGLDLPYIDINSGYYYVIESTFPVKVKVKTPVYFKGMKVGEIDNLQLDTESKNVIIVIRIYNEYGDLINSTTKFWVQSLMDLKLADNRLEMNFAPLPILLLGAIGFDSKYDKEYDKGYNKVFQLYRSVTDAKERKVGFSRSRYKKFIFNFRGDVSSLDMDTPIKYKGFKIGVIEHLKVYYNSKLKNFEAQCFGKIDVSNFSTEKDDGFSNFKDLVKSGIIAKLKKPNFLINQSVIELEENSATTDLVKNRKLNAYILPTKEFKDTNLLLSLSEISKKIENLNLEKSVNGINSVIESTRVPIEKLGKLLESADKSIENLNTIIGKKEFQNIGSDVESTLKEFQKSLKTLNRTLGTYGKDSLFKEKIESLLKELHDLTGNTNTLLFKLNKKPNSLIFGE